ncbi:cytochrome b/b6 domain-containing protein [Salidesulfovibrio onnuriiensis]|uniref:cytochrome b/b6 domain-containing protein n=1 Tax=Salidesulfovibrio onnuriiensis TaxID=2583823 RepID=UPI0011C9A16D|nr:cytochrome b/b6 domain-containing protein [Salidesulfovibrio onnuriiensis]
MSEHKMKKIYLYSRFERFWHWVQGLLIILLLLTGFEVHGSIDVFGFMDAVNLHNTIGITWLILFVFIVFWMFVTHEYKQYIPTTRKLFEVARYYAHGIFRGEPHPVQKSEAAKHNPMQRLTYLGLTAILLPLQMITGLLYWGYNDWAKWGIASFISLKVLAALHLIGGFAILIFLIVHVYMTTTGHTVSAHVEAMITGWEEVPEGMDVEDWEKKTERE